MNLDSYLQKKSEMVEEGKKLVHGALLELFNKFPDVKEIIWTQYTPYFNDGDACVFSVGEPCVVLSGALKKELVDDTYEDEHYTHGEISYYDIKDNNPLKKALKELNKTFQACEDEMQIIYGDHARVIATREDVEIEEYEHD